MADEISTAPAANNDTSTPSQSTPAPVTPAAEVKDDATLLSEAGKETQEKPAATAAKDKAEEKPAAVVPEKYDLKVPEGMALDQAALDTITPVFKDLKLNNEQAQKLADAWAPMAQKIAVGVNQELQNNFSKMKSEWKDESVKALGADHARELAVVAKLVNLAGDKADEVRQIFDESGVGNRLPILNWLVKVGKLLGEDHFVSAGQKTTESVNPLDKMYDHPTSLATLKK